ncbi:MAG: hypothetical protein JSW02_04690 [candidate division WOR-3 bacterium]|nr:MAG: hypothetical protein JSW02_04690 [candidate division WOR-3 bacterium]
MSSTFTTAVTCMDGRIQIPVIEYMKSTFGVAYVDMITEPGPNKILSENTDNNIVGSIRRRVAISVEVHYSKVIAVVGHHDCVGNPTDKETQRHHIHNAVSMVNTWGFDAQVIGLWIDETWLVHEVSPRT